MKESRVKNSTNFIFNGVNTIFLKNNISISEINYETYILWITFIPFNKNSYYNENCFSFSNKNSEDAKNFNKML